MLMVVSWDGETSAQDGLELLTGLVRPVLIGLEDRSWGQRGAGSTQVGLYSHFVD